MKKLLLLSILLLAGCSSQTIQQPTQTATIQETETEKKSDVVELYYWETASFKTYDFSVLDSYETDFIKSNNQFEDDYKATDHSKYVVASVRYLNTSNEEFTWKNGWYWFLTDSKGRKYWDINCYAWVNNCDNYDIIYKPGIPIESQIIFEVANDSEWYYITEQNSVTKVKYKINFMNKE